MYPFASRKPHPALLKWCAMAKRLKTLSPPLSSASDDEESFVVLGSSPPPSSIDVDNFFAEDIKENKLIDTSIVEEALNLIQECTISSNNSSSFPPMPKVSEQEVVFLADKLHQSTITTNSSVDLSPDEIQQKVDLLVEENIKLKETLRQNNLSIKKQYESLVKWQEEVVKVYQSHKEKFAETKKFIQNLKMENVRLELALQVDTANNEKSIASMSNDELLIKLRDAYDKITMLEFDNKKLHFEKYDLEENVKHHMFIKSQAESLQKDLDMCRGLHSQEVADYKKQIQQSDSLQKILLEEVKILKTKSADHLNCIKREELNNMQEQLMAAQMHITEFELKKNNAEDTINNQNLEIKSLQDQLHEGKERMTLLETQLELYKTDFEAEQLQRKNLVKEKEQLVSDLQQLQRRNNQLLVEVEKLRNNGFVHVESMQHPAAATTSTPANASKWMCPKCSFRFASYEILANHVYNCIEIDSVF